VPTDTGLVRIAAGSGGERWVRVLPAGAPDLEGSGGALEDAARAMLLPGGGGRIRPPTPPGLPLPAPGGEAPVRAVLFGLLLALALGEWGIRRWSGSP
jgi:hypothetical protein